MRIPSLFLAACLLTASTSACTFPTEKSDPIPPFGTFTCKATKDRVCIAPTDSFETNSEQLNVVYTTVEVPNNGDVYHIKWIAEEAGKERGDTVISSGEMIVKDAVQGAGSYTVHSQLTRPTKGWPKGSYRVELLLGEKVVTTAKFKIA